VLVAGVSVWCNPAALFGQLHVVLFGRRGRAAQATARNLDARSSSPNRGRIAGAAGPPIKSGRPHADAWDVRTRPRQGPQPDDVRLSAGHAAGLALRELPGALVLVFDTELRFILTAGEPLQRLGNPTAFAEGQALADAFPRE